MATLVNREATIKTATVEIKALTVDGRQVTLALFRQLQQRDLIDPETAQFRGLPWGRVNYHSKECDGYHGLHHHVVWQEGRELRRAWCEEQDAQRATLDVERKANSAFVAGALQMVFIERPIANGKPLSYDDYYGSGNYNNCLEIDGVMKWSGVISDLFWHLCKYWRARDQGETISPSWNQLIRMVDGPEDFLSRSPDEWWDEMRTIRTRAQIVKSEWQRRWQEICALDQLFIAV